MEMYFMEMLKRWISFKSLIRPRSENGVLSGIRAFRSWQTSVFSSFHLQILSKIWNASKAFNISSKLLVAFSVFYSKKHKKFLTVLYAGCCWCCLSKSFFSRANSKYNNCDVMLRPREGEKVLRFNFYGSQKQSA